MKPNVLLVVLDSVRAENTSLHGATRKTTPFLDSFVESEATQYTQARAPGMTSLPSHTSMFCGLEVAEHRMHDSIRHEMEKGHTVWEKLAERGYDTGVFSYNVNLISDTALRDGFDFVETGGGAPFKTGSDLSDFHAMTGGFNSSGMGQFLEYGKWALSEAAPGRTTLNGVGAELRKHVNSPRLERLLERSADRFVDSFLSWSESTDGPWGACINLMDSHHDYYPEPEYDHWGGTKLQTFQSQLDPHPWRVHGGQISLADWQKLEDLYDGTIQQTDAAVQRIVEALKRRGEFDDTLLVVCADHGEGFGEESRVQPSMPTVGHVAGLHEALLHVPLVVSHPGQSNPNQIDELATLRKFHDVALAAATGDNSETFVPKDRPVVASGSNIDDKLKNTDRAAKYCNDTSKFRGTVRAVFEPHNDLIRKYMTWRDYEATIEYDPASSEYRILQDSDARAKVEAEFKKLPESGIRQDHGLDGEINEGTRQRLEELGYV